MLSRDGGENVDPVRALVETRQEVKFAATRSQEGLSTLDAHLLQRLEAVRDESRADDVDAAHTLASVLCQRNCSVGLEPFCPTEARLERRLPLALRETEAPGEKTRRRMALARIGIAACDGVLRQPVKADEQLVRPARACPVLAHQRRERLDVPGMIVKLLDRPDLRNVARAAQEFGGVVEGASSRARGVLRIQGKEEHPVVPVLGQARERRGDRRVAVAHREFDSRPRAEPLAQQLRLPLRMHPQRGALGRPDARVLAGRLPWSRSENEAVEKREPDGPRDLDYARVREELPEIAAHGRGSRRVRRSEIDEQNRGQRRFTVAKERSTGASP